MGGMGWGLAELLLVLLLLLRERLLLLPTGFFAGDGGGGGEDELGEFEAVGIVGGGSCDAEVVVGREEDLRSGID